MDAKQIGEVIKEARKRKGMTQKQLGAVLGVATLIIWCYENGVYEVISFEKRAQMSSVLNIPMSELLYDNEKIACISTNEAVDELKEKGKLIKAVDAELEYWLLSGDVDYLHKAMVVIRTAVEKEEQDAD
jgi:transcriptional regulator with XRE-family HTH domain